MASTRPFSIAKALVNQQELLTKTVVNFAITHHAFLDKLYLETKDANETFMRVSIALGEGKLCQVRATFQALCEHKITLPSSMWCEGLKAAVWRKLESICLL